MSIGEGQSTCIGIGGDPVNGTDLLIVWRPSKPILKPLLLMIGEIGGTAEEDASEWVAENMSKPIVGFVAGSTLHQEKNGACGSHHLRRKGYNCREIRRI